MLAQLDGRLALAGLREPVEVLRDRWGVAHIYAQNQDDLFFAQGVVAAQDRLFQIDMWRRVAVGETAEVLGPTAIESDRFARLVRYRGDMEAEWASYSPDARQIVTAFTRGINAYIDHLGDRLPIEFQLLGFAPKKWRPEDCLGRMSGIIMARNFRNEIPRAELIAAVGLEKAHQVATTDPVRPYAPAPGLDLAGIDASVLAGYRAATRSIRFHPISDGSNNWVIDGTRSASGKPMLASDPHRSINLPSLRYLVHLVAPGWNVIGGGEPGLPGVAIGHNERIAWGFTIVGTDQADIYVEQTHPDDPTRYKVGDEWVPFEVIRESLVVKGRPAPVDLELRFTRHGPVIHQDPPRHRAYALRWVGSEPGTAAYLGSLAVDRARNWSEYLEAMRAWKMPSENMVYADVDGNIGWVAAALTPIRPNWDGLLPVPGAEGAYEWRGFLTVDQLPQRFNPATHVIATANHNILPPGYPHQIAYEWSAGYRYARVMQRLKAPRLFDLDDFKSIQHENTSLPGQALAHLIRTVPIRDPRRLPYAELLAGWDGVLSRSSRAGPVYAFWLPELRRAFLERHVPPAHRSFAAGRTGLPRMLAALQVPDETGFGQDAVAQRDQLVRRTFAIAVEKLEAAMPGDPADRTWGRLHTTTFHHPLETFGPEYREAFNLGPIPRAGDGLTPNAARYNANFEQRSGASYRHVFDLADWDRGLATSAPGQSGQPGSDHYGDLLELWAEEEYFPLTFSRPRVEQVTTNRLRLEPARDP